MKWITIILSFYLIALSNMPCADVEANSIVHQRANFSSQAHSHDKDNDLCSPFCTCNCCGAQILTYQSSNHYSFPIAFRAISVAVPNYRSVFASNFCGSIWQPPQIA